MIKMENILDILEEGGSMVKGVGICLLILSSSMIGFYKSLEFSERLTNLNNLKWCLLLIKGEIKYQPSTLPELFFRTSDKMEKKYQHIFQSLAQQLMRKEGKGFSEIWREVWQREKQHFFFQKEDLEILLSFGKGFGYLDKDTQLSQLEYLITQVEFQVEDAKQKKQSGQRVYQMLGVIGGFFLAILFL